MVKYKLNRNKQLGPLQPVWLGVLNGSNENDFQCIILLKVSYHSHGHETLITKTFYVYKFPLPYNITSPNGNALNEFYKKNEMIEAGQA